jgi:hypothetical protein
MGGLSRRVTADHALLRGESSFRSFARAFADAQRICGERGPICVQAKSPVIWNINPSVVLIELFYRSSRVRGERIIESSRKRLIKGFSSFSRFP